MPLAKFPGLRRTPGLAEIESLLELLNIASLLVERRTLHILLANARANELTAYTRAELAGMRLSMLIEGIEEPSFWDFPAGQPSAAHLSLRKRNGMRVEVQATRLDLANSMKWSVITLEEMQIIQQRQEKQQRDTDLMANMQSLSQALSYSKLDEALQQALQAGHEITGADLLSVYLQDLPAESHNFELVRYSHFGEIDMLPEHLPGQELMLLRANQFWTPGKRPTTSLHRAARAKSLAYLASMPLGQANASIGFLAIAGNSVPEQDTCIAQLAILARVISALIQFHTHTSNLENTLDSQERASRVDQTEVDAIEDALIVLTPTLTLSQMNPAAERFLGYTIQEARGRPVGDILIGTGSMSAILQNAIQGIPSFKLEGIRLYRRSGEPLLAQVSVIPAMTQGQLEGIVILIRDLSEQERIQAQAQQLERHALLGEVSAAFAHEVRNPINNISTGLELMAYNLPRDDPNQQVIARLQQDCERLNDLMKSVLALSRPIDYEMEAVDLGILINRLLERVKPRMVQANIQQFLQIEPSLPLVNGNAHALEQVFTNLITNAIQAMTDKGGTLALKLQKVEDPGGHCFVEIHVADNGPGIPKENVDKVFQPFFTTKPDGTGLGLPITKRIVTAHKGHIDVNSFPGATVFHVKIPVLESP